jgi:hypothetical protein
MENSNILAFMKEITKRSIMATLKAGLWGGMFFALITLLMVVTDCPLELRFLIGAPVMFLKQTMGLSGAPADSFVNGNTFGVIINGLFGALTVGIFTASWQFLLKDNNDE